MGKLTTHVLDTMNGGPAAGMAVSLYRMDGAAPQLLKQLTLNDDGRADQPLLADAALQPGRYRLVFGVLPYFKRPRRGTARAGLPGRGAAGLRHRRHRAALPRAAAGVAVELCHLPRLLTRRHRRCSRPTPCLTRP